MFTFNAHNKLLFFREDCFNSMDNKVYMYNFHFIYQIALQL